MPIQFSCSSCNKTLRVSSKYVGKKAKCPQCITVNVVPAENEEMEAPSSNLEPLPSVSESFGASVQALPKVSAPASAGAASSNPYAISTSTTQDAYQNNIMSQGSGSSGGALNVYRPLYDSIFFLNFLAWTNIIMGGLLCLIIVGVIQGGILLWVGITLKGACDSIKNAFQTGNAHQLHVASNKLATYFKIYSIMTMIALGFAVLYLLFFIGFLILAASAGAGAASGGF